MESIICSLGEEKKQFKQRISDLSKLEKKMQLNLRQFYKQEALERAELERRQREQQLLQLDAHVRSSGSNASKLTSSSVVLELLEEDDIEFGVAGHLPGTPPSTPPHLLELSPSSTTSGPETPARREGSQYYYAMAGAHDDGIRESAPAPGHVRTRSDPLPMDPTDKDKTRATGLSWEEELFNSGCDLFFCATMPLCAGPSAAASVATPHIQPTSSILSGLPPHLYRNDSIGNGSNGDGSTVASSIMGGMGGIDFATGLSGHMGVGRQHQRRKGTPYKKQVRMMSQHDGAAHVRRKKGSNSSVVSVGEATKASVATL